jgi:phosphopantothenoylcysteine decarboxylase/phosphopantothenate--cysteine ligase
MKKKTKDLSLLLRKNPDILAEVASLSQAPFTVGFAAETENLLDNARMKLQNKKLDMIAANQVGEGLGFNVDENELQVFWRARDQGQENQTQENQVIKHQTLERATKEKLARQLIKVIANHYYEKNSAQKNSTQVH